MSEDNKKIKFNVPKLEKLDSYNKLYLGEYPYKSDNIISKDDHIISQDNMTYSKTPRNSPEKNIKHSSPLYKKKPKLKFGRRFSADSVSSDRAIYGSPIIRKKSSKSSTSSNILPIINKKKQTGIKYSRSLPDKLTAIKSDSISPKLKHSPNRNNRYSPKLKHSPNRNNKKYSPKNNFKNNNKFKNLNDDVKDLSEKLIGLTYHYNYIKSFSDFTETDLNKIISNKIKNILLDTSKRYQISIKNNSTIQ